MVLANSVSSPDSSNGRKKSCWALEKRCSSSQHEHFHAGQRAPQMLEPRLRRADAEIALAAGARQQQGQSRLSAAGRAEKKQAGQARGLHERTDLGRKMRLSEEKIQPLRTQSLRQGAGLPAAI